MGSNVVKALSKANLPKSDWLGLAKNAIFVGGGATLVVVLQSISNGSIDLGTYSPYLVPIATTAMGYVAKLVVKKINEINDTTIEDS